MAGGQLDQRVLQAAQHCQAVVDRDPQEEAHVRGDLVVARTPGVQALAGLAHELGQAGLDVEVHVLEVEPPREAALLDLGADLAEARLDGGEVGRADDAHLGQHGRMGQRSGDVVHREALVEVDAGRVAQHEAGHGFGEASGPGVLLGMEGGAGGCGGRRARGRHLGALCHREILARDPRVPVAGSNHG